MNKPIRRVAFVTMIMFALLLANGTYMMIFRQNALAAEPQNRRVRDAEFAQNRGAILAAGKTEIAKTEPSKDRVQVPAGLSRRSSCTPRSTGFYSYDHARTALENTYNSQLAGTDDSLFVRRLIDLATNRTPRGASVQTTIVPKIQEAAAEALGDQKGAVVALDPSTGAVLAMVTSPTYDPNDIASHDIDEANKAYDRLASRPTGRCPTGRPGDLSARVDLQAGHRRRALADGIEAGPMVDPPNRLSCPAPTSTCRTPPLRRHQR